ncbi:ATP-binding protein [Cohnella sp.]|uniref:ATP-binding protein n=1 Tax=Cohnella sp. TaxID=1883426 RepID=UPI003566B1DD
MVNEQTVRKLQEMRLATMAESFQKQLLDTSYQELSFEERFGMLVDLEWSRHKNNRLTSLIRKADFQQSDACIENIEYHADRKLDRTQILRLASGTYIHDKLNMIIMGASGAGKTYLACAFGISACRNFLPVKYIRLPELLNDLAVARGEGIFGRVMKAYKKVPLLILDEWLLVSLKEIEARDLLEIVEARHQTGSTVSAHVLCRCPNHRH